MTVGSSSLGNGSDYLRLNYSHLEDFNPLPEERDENFIPSNNPNNPDNYYLDAAFIHNRYLNQGSSIPSSSTKKQIEESDFMLEKSDFMWLPLDNRRVQQIKEPNFNFFPPLVSRKQIEESDFILLPEDNKSVDLIKDSKLRDVFIKLTEEGRGANSYEKACEVLKSKPLQHFLVWISINTGGAVGCAYKTSDKTIQKHLFKDFDDYKLFEKMNCFNLLDNSNITSNSKNESDKGSFDDPSIKSPINNGPFFHFHLLENHLKLKLSTQPESEQISHENENEELYEALKRNHKTVSSSQEASEALKGQKAGEIRLWKETSLSKSPFFCYAINLPHYNTYDDLVLFNYLGDHLSPFMHRLISMHASNQSEEFSFLMQFLTWNAALDPMNERQLAEAWEQKKFVTSPLEAESALKNSPSSFDYRMWVTSNDIFYAFKMGTVIVSKRINLTGCLEPKKVNFFHLMKINMILAKHEEKAYLDSESKKETPYDYQLILHSNSLETAQGLKEKTKKKKNLKCKVLDLAEIQGTDLSKQQKKLFKKLTNKSRVYLIINGSLEGEAYTSTSKALMNPTYAKNLAQIIEENASKPEKPSERKLRISVLASFGGKIEGSEIPFCQYLCQNLTEKNMSVEVLGRTGLVSRWIGQTTKIEKHLAKKKKEFYQLVNGYYKRESNKKIFYSDSSKLLIKNFNYPERLFSTSFIDLSNIREHFLNLGPLSAKECEKLFNQAPFPLKNLEKTPFLWAIRQDFESQDSNNKNVFITMYSPHFSKEEGEFKHFCYDLKGTSWFDVLSFLEGIWNDYCLKTTGCRQFSILSRSPQLILERNLLIQQAFYWFKQDVEQTPIHH